MKYRKCLAISLACLGFGLAFSNDVKADYYTDYNTSVLDAVFRKTAFDVDIFSNGYKYSLPKITNTISGNNIDELDYSIELLSYNKNAHNYLIFYSLDKEKIPTELFRIPVTKSGSGKIVDKSLLKMLKPNTTFLMNVMSYTIDDRGNIANVSYSDVSSIYYTKKTVELIVKEGDKKVVNRIIALSSEAKENKVAVYPYEIEQYYRPDRYYSYESSKILVDGKEVVQNNLEIPYNSKKIEIELSKNREYWNKINIEYPIEYKKENTSVDIKRNTTINNFLKENKLKEQFEKNDNYEFAGYYIGNDTIDKLLSTQVSRDTIINAKFNTKVVLDNGEKQKETTLLTGDKLSEIDETFFKKDKYYIESYTLFRKSNNEKIKEITNLSEEVLDESIIIKANYKENTNVVSVRQDDYNKRFGKVDESIKDSDITWSQTKKIGDLLSELREKIKPSTGYQTVFRINKKVVDEDSYLTDDIVLEIYFKKVEEDWVNVKFVGKGIDKFLSDGQEVLVNSRIDSMINLPTATGETSREFLGWQASSDYLVVGENSERTRVSKNKLLQTNELGAVVTEKGKNLEFTAVYRKLFNVEFEKTQVGSIALSKGTSNSLGVDEFNSVGDATKNNKIIVVPRAGYSLSHFIADKNVKVNLEKGTKEIFVGQKIEESDLYNIVPTSDLKLTPIFKCDIFSDTLEDMIENHKVKTVEDALNLEFESAENIRRILGPLYYLR